MEISTVLNHAKNCFNEIKNYEYNPRDNAAAIKSVAASIKSFGFAIPVVVDADNVLIAGHTRVAAAKTLGLTEVPVIQVNYLSEQEAQAFRVIDNKVAAATAFTTRSAPTSRGFS